MAPNPLVLNWQDHNSTLISVFENLLKKNTLVDCTLAAGGQYLKAHKIVLSACSSYFELLFSQESEKNPIVILKDVEFQELEAAVNFMYRGEVEVCEDRLAAFLEVAESLQIKGLRCDERTLSSTEESSTFSVKTSSPKSGVPPRQRSRTDALDSPSDGATESISAGCKIKNNGNSAVHQPFQSESSHSSLTLPQSSFSSQCVQDTQKDEDNFGISQSSLTASSQFHSEQNEHLDIKPAIKIECVTDVYGDEKPEDAEMDFVDELTKVEDKEDLEEHNTEIMNDEHLSDEQNVGSGAEYDVDPQDPYKQQPTRSFTQLCDTGSISGFTSILEKSDKSQDSSMQPQKEPQQEAGKHISPRCQKAFSLDHESQKPKRRSDGKRVHKCPYCDYTTIRQSVINLHLRTHTGERPYKCDICERTFTQKGNLKSHVRIHTADNQCPEPGLYKCMYCAYTFNRKFNLKKHIRTHTGEKPYQCPECDFRCGDKSSLIVHRRIHSGEKPYQCPECDYKSSNSSCVVRHRRIHTGEKPYQCPECDYKASDSSHLTKHLRLH